MVMKRSCPTKLLGFQPSRLPNCWMVSSPKDPPLCPRPVPFQNYWFRSTVLSYFIHLNHSRSKVVACTCRTRANCFSIKGFVEMPYETQSFCCILLQDLQFSGREHAFQKSAFLWRTLWIAATAMDVAEVMMIVSPSTLSVLMCCWCAREDTVLLSPAVRPWSQIAAQRKKQLKHFYSVIFSLLCYHIEFNSITLTWWYWYLRVAELKRTPKNPSDTIISVIGTSSHSITTVLS